MRAGYIYTLTILRETSAGLYLGNYDGPEVLLPYKYAPENFQEDDQIEVFIYPDSEDRLIATTRLPIICSGQFGLLKAKDVTPIGAFMDIGTDKDLLVPYKEQKREMEVGKSYMVYMFTDKLSDRLVGSTHINKFLKNENEVFDENQEVTIIPYEITDLGWNAIIDNKYRGLLYANEVFEDITIGKPLTAYIKNIREDDRIDLSLKKTGYVHVNKSTDFLMVKLREHDGFLPLHDKSNPEEIYKTLGMSKKTFKKSVGLLYKERQITITDKGIKLNM